MTLNAIIIGEKAKEPLHYIDSVRAVIVQSAVITLGDEIQC